MDLEVTGQLPVTAVAATGSSMKDSIQRRLNAVNCNISKSVICSAWRELSALALGYKISAEACTLTSRNSWNRKQRD